MFRDSDVYKWVEALSWESGRQPSARLREALATTIGLIGAAQGEDGYLNSHCQVTDPAWRFTDMAMGHELYCAGHLIQAAVAHARATGGDTLLAIARRFADYLYAELGPQGRVAICGHPEIEMALIELYRLTGEQRYLTLACLLLDRRGRGLLGTAPFGAHATSKTTSRCATRTR